MNKNKIVIVATILLTLVASPGFSQSRFQAGGSFSIAQPQNEFKDNVDKLGFGAKGFFLYNVPNSPIFIGTTMGFLIYGSTNREEPFSTTIPDVMVDVRTTNAILLGHLLFRLQYPKGAIRPYLDGLYGFNYLATTTSIENQNWDDEEVASSTNCSDFTSSYGGGAGLLIRVYEKGDKLTGPDEVFIDFGYRYLKGGEAEYLKEGSVHRENGKVTYDINKSTTDIVTWRLGVSVAF